MLIALLFLACSPSSPGSCPSTSTAGTDATVTTDSATTPTDSATPCTPVAWYEDCDQDGQGKMPAAADTAPILACDEPEPDTDGCGYVQLGGDCDDTEPAIRYAVAEVCDGHDNDCNGLADEGVTQTVYADSDGDGYGNPAIHVQACGTSPGLVSNADDCDDTDPSVGGCG